MRLRRLVPFLILVSTLSCCSEEVSSPEPLVGEDVPLEHPMKCVYHIPPPVGWSAALIDEAAEAQMAIFHMKWCFSPQARELIETLRQKNPDIQVLGFLPVLNINLDPLPDEDLQRIVPFYFELYGAFSDDWAYTTTGDTMMVVRDCVFINPFDGEATKWILVDEIVDIIEQFHSSTGSIIDGMMHDYFMRVPFIGDHLRDTVEGEIDLDGDGIPVVDDADEQARLIEWQKAYAGEIRERFGENFIQIANGTLPREDAELARLLNGYYYENFPMIPTIRSDIEGFLTLLQDQERQLLSTAKGKTWSLLANERSEANNWFCLVSSLLADCHYTETDAETSFTGWQFEVLPGTPTGPVVIGEDPNGFTLYSRQFSNGVAGISFTRTGWRARVAFDPE